MEEDGGDDKKGDFNNEDDDERDKVKDDNTEEKEAIIWAESGQMELIHDEIHRTPESRRNCRTISLSVDE
jgi:hypothetical protein